MIYIAFMQNKECDKEYDDEIIYIIDSIIKNPRDDLLNLGDDQNPEPKEPTRPRRAI